MPLPVFAAEREAGLEELVRNSHSLAYVSVAELTDKFAISPKTIARMRNDIAKAKVDDFDLHYLKTLLVSTGWNKNDDVFDQMEVWIARYTPEDKPWNLEHDCARVIGHIIGNYVIQDDGTVVADDTVVESLPAHFHVMTPAVLYKYWDKADLQEQMDLILEEIPEGKWFVSMEALFKGFDYAIQAKDGTSRVVARNEQTAFLTKHLRAYGGNGTYQDMRVGRLLRNIVFSGKGLVRKPANPDSVIFASTESFKAQASISDFLRDEKKSGYSPVTKNLESAHGTNDTGGQEMAIELEVIQKQLAAALAENEKLQASLRDNDVKQIKAQLDAALAAQAKADETVKVAKEDLVKAAADAKAKSDEITALKTKVDETLETLAKANDELNGIKAEQRRLARIAKAKVALKVDEKDEAAVKAAVAFVDSLCDLSDEKFETHVAAIAKFTPAPMPPTSTPAPVAPKATSAPAPMGGKASEVDPAEKNADPAVLENVTEKTEPAQATETTDNGTENVRLSIAKHFGWKAEDADQE